MFVSKCVCHANDLQGSVERSFERKEMEEHIAWGAGDREGEGELLCKGRSNADKRAILRTTTESQRCGFIVQSIASAAVLHTTERKMDRIREREE